MSRAKIAVLALMVALAVAFTLPAAALAAGKDYRITTVVAPMVGLERVEVQNYFGFWIGTKEKPKEKGHAPLVLAFVFNIMNPNSIPVKLENFKYTVAFEGYDMNTAIYTNPMWIPAGKTNQLRVVMTFSSRAALLNLLVTSGFKLKEQGVKAPALIKKWWTTIPDMAFPIEIHSGTALFSYEGGEVTSTFVGSFGGK